MLRRLGKLYRACPSWVGRLALSVVLLGAVALWVEPFEIAAEVRQFAPGWVLLALGISVVQVVLSAWRWQLTATRIGVPLRLSYALREYYLAMLVNQLLPGGMLGDAGRAHRHAAQAASRGSAWRAVIIERASGQVAALVATLAALTLSPLWLAVVPLPVIGALVVTAAACCALFFWLLYRRGAGFSRQNRVTRWLGEFASDLRRGLLAPGVWPRQVGTSLLVVLSYASVMWCAARAIGVDIPAWQLFSLAPVVLAFMLIPFSVAGWGVREGAAASIWLAVGLPAAQGVAVSLAYGVLVLLGSLPGAWVALKRRTQAAPSTAGGQLQVEQGVLPAAESARGRAKGGIERLDGRHTKPGAPRADQQRRHQHMQAVDHARLDEVRNGNAAALDQKPPMAQLFKQVNDVLRGELPLSIERERAALNVRGHGRGRCRWPYQVQRRCGGNFKQRQAVRHAPARVKHHAYGVRAFDMAHGELRVIGAGGTRANQHGVAQGTQTVQMNQALLPVDVVRMAAFGGDSPIQTLTQLGYHPRWLGRQRRQTLPQLAGLDVCLIEVRRFAVYAVRTPLQQGLPRVGKRQGAAIRAARYCYVSTMNVLDVGHDASVLGHRFHDGRRLPWAQGRYCRHE